MKELLLNPKPTQHLFVCINKKEQGPCCGNHITQETISKFRAWLREQAPLVKLTRVQCLGLCHEEGGAACIWPEGKFYLEIQNEEDLKNIVKESTKRALL